MPMTAGAFSSYLAKQGSKAAVTALEHGSHDWTVQPTQMHFHGLSCPVKGTSVANHLKREKAIQAIGLLCEGTSIRSASRLTGIHQYTIGKLLLRVGAHCQSILDDLVRDLVIDNVELDEAWTFVACKQRMVREDDPMAHEKGSWFVFTAIDPLSKLFITHRIGRRDEPTTVEFVRDLASRLQCRTQISADGWPAYPQSVYDAFEGNVAFGQVIKEYVGAGLDEERRYAPPRVRTTHRRGLFGLPRTDRISTSMVERSNWTLRTFSRRYTRLCAGFSKRLPHLKAATAMFVCWYNFCWIHRSLGMTPAMAAGITSELWTVDRLIPKKSN